MDVLVLGGSFAGLTTGLLLAQRGHQVTVVERDDAPPADKAVAAVEWPRPSTPQLRHSHVLVGRGAEILRTELPTLWEDLLAHGANPIRPFDFLPPGVSDRAPRPESQDVTTLCVRRPVIDWALTREADRTGLQVERTMARGLLMEQTTVAGLSTDAGDLRADLVVDASGRRSRVPRWLGEVGIEVPQERSTCGCVYLTRAYSLAGQPAPGPFLFGFGTSGPTDGFTLLLFRGDDDAFTISLQLSADDKDLLIARDPAAFTSVASAIPWCRPWVEAATPLTDVSVMAGLDNTSRRLVRDGAPLVTGLLQVGDCATTTNPTLGRGMSLSLIGSQLLLQVLDLPPEDRLLALDRLRTDQIDPFVREAWGVDERAVATVRHQLFGDPLPERPAHALPEELFPFTMTDREAWERQMLKNNLLRLPSTLFAEGDLEDRVLAARATMSPFPFPVSRTECITAAQGALA